MRAKNIKMRVNRACKYYPCHKPKGSGLASNSQSHKDLEDCTFCYCPYYPCFDNKRGSYVYGKNGKKIWSCMDCSWIHKKAVVDNIFRLIRENSPIFRRPLTKEKIKTGIIILGHGSKLKGASQTMRRIAGAISRKQYGIVEQAHLQFHQPGISVAIKKLVDKGCKKVIIVPFFLLMGNHVTRDIPEAIKREKVKYPGVDFVYAKNLGDDPRIGGIVLDRIREAMLKCR